MSDDYLEGQWQADGRLKLTAVGLSARIIMVDADGKPTADVSVPPHEFIFVNPPKDAATHAFEEEDRKRTAIYSEE